MLSVRLLSGEEVAKVPLQEELRDVRSLKQNLHRLHGLPPRFRQRLLLDGEALEDAARIDAPVELELVLLASSAVSDLQMEELLSAASHGSVAEVGIFW